MQFHPPQDVLGIRPDLSSLADVDPLFSLRSQKLARYAQNHVNPRRTEVPNLPFTHTSPPPPTTSKVFPSSWRLTALPNGPLLAHLSPRQARLTTVGCIEEINKNDQPSPKHPTFSSTVDPLYSCRSLSIRHQCFFPAWTTSCREQRFRICFHRRKCSMSSSSSSSFFSTFHSITLVMFFNGP